MSGRNWREHLANGLGILLLVGILFAVGWSYIELSTEQRVSEFYAGQYEGTDSNQEIGNLCSDLAELARVECEIQKIQTRQEWTTDRRDLNAQEWMAYWAAWMFLVTTLGALATVAGVYYVRKTLIQADETNRAALAAANAANVANAIMRNQQRAWMTISPKVVEFRHSEEGYLLQVEIEHKNCGSAGAENVIVEAEAKLTTHWSPEELEQLLPEIEQRTNNRLFSIAPSTSYTSYATILPTYFEMNKIQIQDMEGYVTLVLSVWIRYRANDKWRTTFKAFTVGLDSTLLGDRFFPKKVRENVRIEDFKLRSCGPIIAT